MLSKIALLTIVLALQACEAGSSSTSSSISTPERIEPRRLSFERVEVFVGTPTHEILTASFDGDDHLDLLLVGGDRVIGLRGLGDGRFEIAGSVPAGENAVDLALADLDEDGIDDLVVANHDTHYVTRLYGTVGGRFEARATSRLDVDVSPHPHAVRLRDVDGDGHVDLLVDDRDAEAIRVFLGAGDGRFDTSFRIAVGGDPYRGMSLVDVDADGAFDLITPNPDHVAVLIGDGSGSFTRGATLRPAFSPFSASAADVDGDGVLDVVAGSGEGRGTLAIWYGTPEGEFEVGETFDLAVGPTRLAAADLDGDGREEIVVTSYVGGEIAVLATGDDANLNRIGVDGHPYGIATGDYDGDGAPDVAVANGGAEHVTIFLSRRSQTPASSSIDH